MSRARAFLTQTSIAAMSTGSRALPLLCRKTRVLPRDATRLVRECLRMRLGEHCPAWIDELLWRHLPRLEDGRLGALVIVASRTVDPGICPKGEINFGETGSNETETDDAGVLVTFWLEVSDCTSRCSCFWKLTCDESAPQGDSRSRAYRRASRGSLMTFAVTLTVAARGRVRAWMCQPP